MICAEFFHFFAYGFGHHISWLKLIGKSFSVFIKKNSSLAANAFAY